VSCAVTLTFTPLAVLTYSAQLQFVTNAGTSPDNVTLTGNGTPSTVSAPVPIL